MRRRLLALSLSLVLLLAQQLGAAHLLGHLVSHPGQPAGPSQAVVGALPAGLPGASTPDSTADAGDALCQVCLVLAALAAGGLPVVWGWLAQQARAAAPQARRQTAAVPPAPRPWLARGPPTCLA